jgi:hypothetical protein
MAAAARTTTQGSDDPFEAVSDFFDSQTWEYIVRFLFVFAIALWLALAYWVFSDARRRIQQPVLIALCVAVAVLLPFAGAIIYLIVRPPEYLADARERELETLALERRLELEDDGFESLGRGVRPTGVDREYVRALERRLSDLEAQVRALDPRSGSRSRVDRLDPGPVERRPDPLADPPRGRRASEAVATPEPELEETATSSDTGRISRWRRPRLRPSGPDDDLT